MRQMRTSANRAARNRWAAALLREEEEGVCGKGETDELAAWLVGDGDRILGSERGERGERGGRETGCVHRFEPTEEGSRICVRCGEFVEDCLDTSCEWKTSADGRKQLATRAYSNPFIEDSPVYIGDGGSHHKGGGHKGGGGWVAPSRGAHREKKLMKYAEFQHILACAARAGICRKIVDDALRMYATVWNAGARGARGFTKEGIVAAALHLACRANGAPRTIKEISTTFGISQHHVTQGCSIATAILSQLDEESEQMDCVSTPASFVPRFCSALNIPDKYAVVCAFVADRLHTYHILTENTPNTVAAGVIYFVARTAGLPVTLSDVQLASDISEVTIHKCSTKLAGLKEHLLPSAVVCDMKKERGGSGGAAGGAGGPTKKRAKQDASALFI